MESELSRVLKIKKFWEEILKMSNESDVIDYFKKNGIDVTQEELVNLKKFINSIADKLEDIDASFLKETSDSNFWSSTPSNATLTPLDISQNLRNFWSEKTSLDFIDSETELNEEGVENTE